MVKERARDLEAQEAPLSEVVVDGPDAVAPDIEEVDPATKEPVVGADSIMPPLPSFSQKNVLSSYVQVTSFKMNDASPRHSVGRPPANRNLFILFDILPLKADDWIRVTLEVCGGRGGGRPTSAQGQAPACSDVSKVIDAANSFATERVEAAGRSLSSSTCSS